MADAFNAFTARQLQQVATDGPASTEGLIYPTLPIAQVDDVATGFQGVTFTLEHPLTNLPEQDAGSILAYGEHPHRAGDKRRTNVTLTAQRRATLYDEIIEGFNTDPHRLARLEQLGPIKVAEMQLIVERAVQAFIFNSTNYTTLVDLSGAAASLEDLAPTENIFVNVYSALRANNLYRYKALLGASLEAFVYEEDLPIFGEYLELTGVLGRENATSIRLNPGAMSNDAIVAAIKSRFRLDAIHVFKHAPNIDMVNGSGGAVPGLSKPNDDKGVGAAFATGAMFVTLVDRRSGVYNLRTDNGQVLKPRFGPVLTTAAQAISPMLRSFYDEQGRIERVWSECSFGINDITLLTSADAAFQDIPAGILFHGISPA